MRLAVLRNSPTLVSGTGSELHGDAAEIRHDRATCRVQRESRRGTTYL